MTREIKFRAWDGREIIKDWFVIEKSSAGNGVLVPATMSRMAIEVMQSTGMTDKNGVLIYEGDIVKAHYFYFDGNFDADGEIIGEIMIGADGVWIDNKKKFEENKSMFVRDTTHYEEPCLEIIGNIYENGDLLKN